jgi:hypothetical protein
MGTLVVMHYPLNYLAQLADHTYVKCATGGAAWKCWGGKTGGDELRRAPGSTKQANAIAETDEKAGIRCYLINGVCHQSANRILFPAGITAQGARGYDISEALFGPYGRPRGPFGTCQSPFDQHGGVTGDLAACAEAVAKKSAKAPRKNAPARSIKEHQAERRYIRGVLAIYRQAQPLLTASNRSLLGRDLEGFQLRLFMYKVRYNLGDRLGRSAASKLQDLRLSTERSRMKIEDWFANGEMKLSEFVQAFNRETILFQEAAAGALRPAQYKALFGLEPGENVILADPRVIRRMTRDTERR